MDKPVLIIMAAGMGSRYGGLKQMDPVDEYGHMLMDYSVFDAKRAGFERVIIVIKPEMEALFEEKIGSRLRKYISVDYAYQVLENLPEGFSIPEGCTGRRILYHCTNWEDLCTEYQYAMLSMVHSSSSVPLLPS